MVKYVYKVLKQFSLTKSLKNNKRIAETDDEEKHGSTFTKNTNYVDYESEEREIAKHPLTLKLEDMNYIELVTVTKV